MTDTIYIYDDYTVARSVALDFEDQSGFIFEGQHEANLVNKGSVDVHGRGDLWGFRLVGAFTSGTALYRHSVFTNQATGNFVVHATGLNMDAYGYLGVSWGPTFRNDGTFVVISDDSDAWGVSTTASDDTFINNGVFKVSAFDEAFGVQLGNGGTYVNTGSIDVHGGAIAFAVILGSYASSFDNSGLVTASAGNPDGRSIGVWVGGSHTVTNSGVIVADHSIEGDEGAAQVINSGKLKGKVDLGASQDVVNNSGSIRGDVDLGRGDDLLDGAHGKIVGVVYGGLGADTLKGGSKDDVMHGDTGASDGQDAADMLWGGIGDDQLFGDGANDTIIGGRGADLLSGGRLADTFVYETPLDSTAAEADRIVDLGGKDLVDLTRLDADVTVDGNQAFTRVAALGGHAGQLAVSYDAVSRTTTIEGDVDGDGSADLLIQADGDHSDFVRFAL